MSLYNIAVIVDIGISWHPYSEWRHALWEKLSSVRWSIVQASGNVLTVAGSPVNGEASSPPPAINDNRPSGDNLDTILFQLRQVTRERDELRKRLALASPGTTFDDCRLKSCPACHVVVTVFLSFW